MIRFALVSALLLSSAEGQVNRPPNHGTPTDQRPFRIVGLFSPAVISGSIFIDSPSLPERAIVTYFLDDRPCGTTNVFPYYLQGESHSFGYSLDTATPGAHQLRAEARLSDRRILHSDVIDLDVVPSINRTFSPGLTTYKHQPSAQFKTIEEAFRSTSNPAAVLSSVEIETRKSVLAMYMNWGIDPSLDSNNDESERLFALTPQGWAEPQKGSEHMPASMMFSPDAPFYQAIPKRWPRVLLPAGYINGIQLNTNKAGDGIGFGQSIAQPGDSARTIRSQWYDNAATLRTFPFRMRAQWQKEIPWQQAGDMHMIFIDPLAGEFVSSYKTSMNSNTGGANSLYATSPTKLGTLGDKGGSISAHFAELPAMLQPGEAIDPNQPIRHALGGPVGRVWAARVYPAYARDANVMTSQNACTNGGFTNTGLVPYGGVIQLDPALNLSSLGLTLPAFRILQAIQTYGYYVEDFGCADMDIYTAISETEFDPWGGLWGYNRHGIGVQNEIAKVLTSSKLYVVAPLVKKQ